MSALRDWTDPEWRMEELPETVAVAYVEACPNCAADFGTHCFSCECPMWAIVGCHRVHYEDGFWGVPAEIRPPWYFNRN